MSKRISDLTAKGANLDATDLLEISESDGLGGYVSKSITGAEIPNLGNQDLAQTDAVREYDIDGGVLNFINGQFVIGTPFSTTFAQELNGNAGNALFVGNSVIGVYVTGATNIGGYFEGSNKGIAAYSSGAGKAVYAQQSSNGVGVYSDGTAHIETYSFAATKDASTVLQLDSNTQGFVVPRMTTTQRDAISSPATGLEIFNTTTSRFEFYNGTYWRGLNMRFHPIQFASWSPTDAQTVAFGSHPFIPVQASISPAPFEIVMRGNGVIRGCDFNTYASGVAGSNEAWSLYVRHNGTDYLVQTQSLSTANRVFTNQSLNIPFVDGDIVRMIFVNPTWGTNPTNVAAAGSLNIQ